MSVYPDQCVLQLERRTVSGEEGKVPLAEVDAILTRLRAQDNQFDASAKLMTSRPPYSLDPSHALPQALAASLASRKLYSLPSGASFWTDAAILAAAGIPSVLFGPGGAGLHSVEEYVRIADVTACRDTLVTLVRDWSSQAPQGS